MNREKLDLMSNKLYLIGKPTTEYVKPTSKKPGNYFLKTPLVYRESGSGTRQTMNTFIDQFDIKVGKKLELTSNEAVKQAILAGMGNSRMPIIGIKNEIISGELEILPMKGLPIVTTWSLIWLKGKKHSPAAAAYLHYLKEEKSKVEEKYFSWHHAY